MCKTVRQASHAGSWYTDSGPTLSRQLDEWLAAVQVEHPGTVAQAVIAPHAGFSYSGPTAAWAYRYIDAERVDRVFILGPSHHFYLPGCALSRCDEYETPLGNLALDRDVIRTLHSTGKFEWMSLDVDEQEHSIEMHLPYIHKVMERKQGAYTVVPILVGALSNDAEAEYGRLLAPMLANPRHLFVISSDFCHWGRRFSFTPHDPSHGPIHKSIEALDREGMQLIASLDAAGFAAYLRSTRNTICGRHPIAVLLHALAALPPTHAPRLVFTRYAQSSAATKPTDSSVSYASAICALSPERASS